MEYFGSGANSFLMLSSENKKAIDDAVRSAQKDLIMQKRVADAIALDMQKKRGAIKQNAAGEVQPPPSPGNIEYEIEQNIKKKNPENHESAPTKREKKRITDQSKSYDYNRTDHFSIGTVYFRVPPSQISISESAHNFRVDSLRSKGESVYSSGRTTTQISLDIYFSGVEDINGKLRTLLAQFKTTPFLPIQSSYLQSILNPFNASRDIVGGVQTRERQLKTLEERRKEVNEIISLINNVSVNKDKIREVMDKLLADGAISASDYRVIMVTGVNNLDKLPKSFLQESDYIIDERTGNRTISLKRILNRVVTVSANNEFDVVARSRRLDEIDVLKKEIDELNRKSAELHMQALEERFLNKQLVGVLSQFAISTVPDFSDTLACRIILFVFNYDPFLEDYLFIEGYDKNKATADITKCDMFIDWYTRRFLSNRDNGLKEYIVNDLAVIRYPLSSTPINQAQVKEGSVKVGEIAIGNGCSVCSGITVSFRNKIQFLPILSSRMPTCQYLGSFNSDIQLNILTNDIRQVNEFSRMNERIGMRARLNNRIGRNSFIYIENSLLAMCGLKFFVINNYDVDTIPGNPGLYEIKISLSEYRLETEFAQKLTREGIVTNEGIQAAAEFILRKAKDFFDINLNETSAAQGMAYRRYNTLVFDRNVGWLSDKQNVIFRLYREKHRLVTSLMEPKWNDLYQEVWAEATGVNGDPEYRDTRRRLDIASERITALRNLVTLGVVNIFDYYSDGRVYSSGFFEGQRKLGENIQLIDTSSGEAFIRFSDNLIKSAKSGDQSETSLFNRNIRLLAKVIAFTQREEIIKMLLDPANNEELYNIALNANRYKRNDIRKQYCYPDLSLPTYETIGSDQRVTYAEAGLQPSSPEEVENTPQAIGDEVDPDFYMYKYRFWTRVMDHDSVLAGGIADGIDSYRRLVYENKLYRVNEAPNEMALSRLLESSMIDYSSDDQEIKSPEDIRSKLQGKLVDVRRIVDGDTIIIVARDGTEYKVRISGYDSPELNEGKEAGPEDGAIESLGALASILLKKRTQNQVGAARGTEEGAQQGGIPSQSQFYQVRLYFGDSIFDATGGSRLLADVIVDKEDGTAVNVTTEMFTLNARNRGLFLRPTDFPDNDMALAYEESFYTNLADMYVREMREGKESKDLFDASRIAALKTLNLGAKAIDPTFGPVKVGVFAAVTQSGWSLINNLSKNRSTKESLVEAKYEGITGFIEYAKESVALTAFDQGAGVPFKESANDVVANIYKQNKNKYNLQRFDRSADQHVSNIANKIREGQKDDLLRISRAFPTYRIYFIEEDVPEWGLLNDYYSYDAVTEISVTRSRSDPVDAAVITFLNTKGVLDKEQFGISDVVRKQKESFARNVQETFDEQDDLSSFILKAGTRIQIRMGYSSDPDLLDTVFNGVVAEVSGGDMIQVIAQGYGYQLLNYAGDSYYRENSAAAYKILDKLISRPELLHFGRWKFVPEQNHITKTLGRRPQFRGGKYVLPSWWRNIFGIRHILEFRQNIADDNIWVPEQSWLYNVFHGDSQNFVVSHKSIWDVFQEMSRRMPGFIAMPLLFDDRATMYFGPADFLYWASDKHSYKRREHLFQYNNAIEKTSFAKMQMLSTSTGKHLRVATDAEIKNAIAPLGRILEAISKDVGVFSFNKPSPRQKLSGSTGLGGGRLSKPTNYMDIFTPGYTTPSRINKEAVDYLNTTVRSRIDERTEDGKKAGNILDVIIAHAQYGGNYLFVPVSTAAAKSGGSEYDKLGITIDILPRDNAFRVNLDEIYIDDDGKLYSEKGIASDYDAKALNNYFSTYPDMKLVRSYHYKDSIHHIIGNNITASEQYFNNKVTIEYGKEKVWRGNKLAGTPGGPSRLPIQADDDLWPERIREITVQEQNAGDIITAWTYGLGNLHNEMRKMYTGDLTILGDPSIKPYDIIFMSDYYTDMFGPIEVERVTHQFSPDTGFTTTISPNLLCYVSNVMSVGNTILAGSYYDAYTKKIVDTRAKVAFFTFGQLDGIVSRLQFSITRGSKSRREPIAFSPLIYAGRPYIAGLEGLRPTSWYESFLGKVDAFKQKYFVDTPEYIKSIAGIVSTGLERGR